MYRCRGAGRSVVRVVGWLLGLPCGESDMTERSCYRARIEIIRLHLLSITSRLLLTASTENLTVNLHSAHITSYIYLHSTIVPSYTYIPH